MLRREDELEPLGPACQVGLGLLGEVRGVVIQDQAQGSRGRVDRIQMLEEFDEVLAFVSIADRLRRPAIVEIQTGYKSETVPRRLNSQSRVGLGYCPGAGGQSGGDRLNPGLLVVGYGLPR